MIYRNVFMMYLIVQAYRMMKYPIGAFDEDSSGGYVIRCAHVQVKLGKRKKKFTVLCMLLIMYGILQVTGGMFGLLRVPAALSRSGS